MTKSLPSVVSLRSTCSGLNCRGSTRPSNIEAFSMPGDTGRQNPPVSVCQMPGGARCHRRQQGLGMTEILAMQAWHWHHSFKRACAEHLQGQGLPVPDRRLTSASTARVLHTMSASSGVSYVTLPSLQQASRMFAARRARCMDPSAGHPPSKREVLSTVSVGSNTCHQAAI